ncbi:DUF6941 family protein [Lysinibacillus sp. NPDC058147]|uniref:DUF6941 family protein n=1 Tax=unclassified Lysinibacillus TaxID=2636778 RepID=UPI0036D8930F
MKPIVSSFMFFDDVQHMSNSSAPGSALHLINPQNIIRTPFIPSTYSFAVAFGVTNINTEESHILSFQLVNPINEVIVDTSEIHIQPERTDKIVPIEARGYTFNLNLRNVKLQYEGKYVGRIFVSKELIGEFPLFVYPVGD